MADNNHIGHRGLTSNAFWLITLIFAAFSWVVSMAGLAAIQASLNKVNAATTPNFSVGWWNWFLEFMIIVGLAFTLMAGIMLKYRLLFVGLLVLSLSYITSEANDVHAIILLDDIVPNTLTASDLSKFNCYLAGLVMMALVFFAWLIVLGSDSDSYIGNSVTGMQTGSLMGRANNNTAGGASQANINSNSQSEMAASNDNRAIPASLAAGAATGAAVNSSISPSSPKTSAMPSLEQPYAGGNNTNSVQSAVSSNANMKATALYAYVANSEDPNEISFEKGQLFDVVDNKGKWWQVQNPVTGQLGIAPSNYLQLTN